MFFSFRACPHHNDMLQHVCFAEELKFLSRPVRAYVGQFLHFASHVHCRLKRDFCKSELGGNRSSTCTMGLSVSTCVKHDIMNRIRGIQILKFTPCEQNLEHVALRLSNLTNDRFIATILPITSRCLHLMSRTCCCTRTGSRMIFTNIYA